MFAAAPMTSLVVSPQETGNAHSAEPMNTALQAKGTMRRSFTKRSLEDVFADVESNEGVDPDEVLKTYTLRGTYSLEEALSLKGVMQPQSNDKEIHVGEMVAEELFFMWPFSDEVAPRRYFEDCTAWVERNVAETVLSSIVFMGADASYCRILASSAFNPFTELTALSVPETSFYEVVGAKYGIAAPQVEPVEA
jgi:hypothetical protein